MKTRNETETCLEAGEEKMRSEAKCKSCGKVKTTRPSKVSFEIVSKKLKATDDYPVVSSEWSLVNLCVSCRQEMAKKVSKVVNSYVKGE